jgi:DNA polymerase III epsilon subunit-like protein
VVTEATTGPGRPLEGWPEPGTALDALEYVVVDVETTGAGVSRGHRVTEIAAVRLNGAGEVLEEFCTLVDPERHIPSFISRLTNITNEMVAGAPRFRDIAGDVRRLLSGAVFVAHNAGFDLGFVSGELSGLEAGTRDGTATRGYDRRRRTPPALGAGPVRVSPVPAAAGGLALVREALGAAGYALVRRADGPSPVLMVADPASRVPAGSGRVAAGADTPMAAVPAGPVSPLAATTGAAGTGPVPVGQGGGAGRPGDTAGEPAFPALCTVRLSRRLVPEVPRRSLDVLADFFGIENEARHRALGDARVTAELFRRLRTRLTEREVGSWGELQAVLAGRARRRKRQANPTSMEDA